MAKQEKIKLNRLKQVLAALDIQQKDFAEQTGYSANTISRWCSNQQQPSLETLHDIALILKIDVRRLIVATPDQINLDDEV